MVEQVKNQISQENPFLALNNRDRLLALQEISTLARTKDSLSQQEKKTYADCVVATQHMLVDGCQPGDKQMKLEQKNRISVVFSSDIFLLSRKGILLPTNKEVAKIKEHSIRDYVDSIGGIIRSLQELKKTNQPLSPDQGQKFIAIIISFQHMLANRYADTDNPIHRDEIPLIDSNIQLIGITIDLLATFGVKLPVKDFSRNTNFDAIKQAGVKVIDKVKDQISSRLTPELIEQYRQQAKEKAEQTVDATKTFVNFANEKLKGMRIPEISLQNPELQAIIKNGIEQYEKNQELYRKINNPKPGDQIIVDRPFGRFHHGDKIQIQEVRGDFLIAFIVTETTITRDPIVIDHKIIKKNRRKISGVERAKVRNRFDILGRYNDKPMRDTRQQYFTQHGMSMVAGSDRGENYKNGDGTLKNNEDRVVVLPQEEFAAVIDGMGGYGDGDKVADIIARRISENPNDIEATMIKLKTELEEMANEDKIARNAGAVFGAAKIIRHPKEENSNREKIELQYTYTGDCSLIVIGKNGKVKHISKEDSLVNSLYTAGQISEDEKLYHSQRNVTLGAVSSRQKEKLHIKSETISISKGDRIIIMSDGIADNLTPEEIAELIKGKTADRAHKILDETTQERMTDYEKTEKETADRSKKTQYSDGYKSKPKPDNRSLVIMDIY